MIELDLDHGQMRTVLNIVQARIRKRRKDYAKMRKTNPTITEAQFQAIRSRAYDGIEYLEGIESELMRALGHMQQ